MFTKLSIQYAPILFCVFNWKIMLEECMKLNNSCVTVLMSEDSCRDFNNLSSVREKRPALGGQQRFLLKLQTLLAGLCSLFPSSTSSGCEAAVRSALSSSSSEQDGCGAPEQGWFTGWSCSWCARSLQLWWGDESCSGDTKWHRNHRDLLRSSGMLCRQSKHWRACWAHRLQLTGGGTFSQSSAAAVLHLQKSSDEVILWQQMDFVALYKHHAHWKSKRWRWIKHFIRFPPQSQKVQALFDN